MRMTDAKWRNCIDPRKMLDYLDGRGSVRKARLFACAVCRRIWYHIPKRRCRDLVELAELYADSKISWDELKNLSDDLEWKSACRGVAEAALDAAGESAWGGANEIAILVTEVHPLIPPQFLSALLRDQFGPFVPRFRKSARPRLVIDPGWLVWNGGVVARLAGDIYEERRFADLPILAD